MTVSKKYMKKFSAFFTTMFFTLSSVQAASPTSKVGGATVHKGQKSVEMRFGYSADDEASTDKRVQLRQHIDYGLNDWYALRAIAAQDKPNGSSLEHDSIVIENRFQLVESQDYGWDGGVRFIYKQNDGDKAPNEAGVSLVAQLPFWEKWELRHNTILEHDIGAESDDGVSLALRHQLTRDVGAEWGFVKKVNLGVAIFNDFGRLRDLSGYSSQDHELRPIVKTSFENNTFIKMGLGVGISSASPDCAFKLSFGKKF
jgi:hypothetical protein